MSSTTPERARKGEAVVTLRLTTEDPVPGLLYSLQDKAGRPVDARTAGESPISFDVSVRLAPGPRFLGGFVRSEGAVRQFVYLAIGRQAGDPAADFDRRAKIDINDIPPALLAQAAEGAVLEAVLPGRALDGGPACATVRPFFGWKVAP
ncbi:MAG TPA: DUF5990 family protein [Caulobacteraceae bacterium]